MGGATDGAMKTENDAKVEQLVKNILKTERQKNKSKSPLKKP